MRVCFVLLIRFLIFGTIVLKQNSIELTDKQGSRFYAPVENPNDSQKSSITILAFLSGVRSVSSEAQTPFFSLLFSPDVSNVFAAVWLGISVLIFVLLLQLVIKSFTKKP